MEEKTAKNENLYAAFCQKKTLQSKSHPLIKEPDQKTSLA